MQERKRGEEELRRTKSERAQVGGVMEVKLCECEAIIADVRRSNNLPSPLQVIFKVSSSNLI